MCIRDRLKDGAVLICDDEGKLKGLRPNRRLGGDLIVGTFLIAGVDAAVSYTHLDLLEKDKAHLGSVQLQTATAREFVLAVRLEAVREKEKYPYLARVEDVYKRQALMWASLRSFR